MSRFQIGGVEYEPGKYEKTRPGQMVLVDKYFEEWEAKQRYKGSARDYQLPPNICLSREIGVGALEIADLLSKDLGLPVVDKSLLDFICGSAQLTEKTVKLFDERHPGLTMEISSWLFGEKSFMAGDYSKGLLRSVAAIAGLGPNVFVGRGVYLLLPRSRILAVRIVAPQAYRMERISRILEIEMEPEQAAKELEKIDQEQKGFFRKIFKKHELPVNEFDLVISRDQYPGAASVAAIIKAAFGEKFGGAAE